MECAPQTTLSHQRESGGAFESYLNPPRCERGNEVRACAGVGAQSVWILERRRGDDSHQRESGGAFMYYLNRTIHGMNEALRSKRALG